MKEIADALLEVGWVIEVINQNHYIVNKQHTLMYDSINEEFAIINQNNLRGWFNLSDKNLYETIGRISIPKPYSNVYLDKQNKLIRYGKIWAFYYGD